MAGYDWDNIIRRMEESAARIRKAQADKEARRITVTRKPDGRRADTFILSKPESTMYLTASRTELYALLGEIRKALKE